MITVAQLYITCTLVAFSLLMVSVAVAAIVMEKQA